MKKIVILSMLLLIFTVAAFAAGTARTYTQKVVAADPGVDILTLVTGTATTYTAPNYTVTADVVETPGEVLQTGIAPTSTLKLYKSGNGTTVPYFAAVVLQLGSFTTQWVAAQTVRIVVTKTDVAGNPSTTWDLIIPPTTTVINYTNYPTYVSAQQNIPPLAPAGYDVQVNCNLPAMIYDGAESTGFRAPHLFTLLTGSHTYSVEPISTVITPAPQTVTAAGTVTFTYTNAAGTTGGGGGGAVVAPGEITLPVTTGVAVTGTVNGAGLLVVTQVAPSATVKGGPGYYHGYQNVFTTYQVWASDVSILNGATLNFNYTAPVPNHYYVAVHWGGANHGYWPTDFPETPGVSTPGYAFGAAVSQSGYTLGMAPFTGAHYIAPILTIGPIPTYLAKGPGTFEIILNNGMADMGGDYDLPVELSSFAAVATAQMFVNLAWTTESETGNLGFNVLRSTDNNVNNATQVNFQIISGTNTSTTQNYTFVDNTVDPETTYYYWLEMVSQNNTSSFSNFVMVTTHVTPPVVVAKTELGSAFPNPFNVNNVTTIPYTVKTGETATLTIYNVLGQTVKTYALQNNNPNITWNGRDDNGAACGSGIYFYKLSSPSVNTTKKMVIVK